MKKKVALQKPKEYNWRPPGRAIKWAKLALPFYKSRKGVYVHRVRSMNQYWKDGQFTHAAVEFWCGNNGHFGEKGYLMATVPPGEVCCATCEGRAIGAGMDGARQINGREVMFSPRRGARHE